MWLRVHERYRAQMQLLVDAATGDGFDAFLGKIKAHSEFEVIYSTTPSRCPRC